MFYLSLVEKKLRKKKRINGFQLIFKCRFSFSITVSNSIDVDKCNMVHRTCFSYGFLKPLHRKKNDFTQYTRARICR